MTKPVDYAALNRHLLDLQDLCAWSGMKRWRFSPHKIIQTQHGPVEMCQVLDHRGKLVMTLGLNPGDEQTRLLVSTMIHNFEALIAGASLTVQMYVATEEVLGCQTMKEREGLTDAVRDRTSSAWTAVRTLLDKIRGTFAPFVTPRSRPSSAPASSESGGVIPSTK